jgi:hypothetical protein
MSDQISSNQPEPAAAPPPPQSSKASRWVKKIVGAVLVLVFGLIVLVKIITFGDLPGCDSKIAKDRLSTNNVKNQVNASHYTEIKTLNKTDDEITCAANLALKAGGTLELDYKLIREGDGSQLIITRFERKL